LTTADGYLAPGDVAAWHEPGHVTAALDEVFAGELAVDVFVAVPVDGDFPPVARPVP
jgi:hypothetical protein